MERELTESYPCPYSVAVRCNLQDPCKGCETWTKYLVGEEISRMVPQPERKTAEEIETKILLLFDKYKKGENWPNTNMPVMTRSGFIDAMHEFALQSREMPSEEEIENWITNEIPVNVDDINDEETSKYCRKAVRLFYEWLKSKLG